MKYFSNKKEHYVILDDKKLQGHKDLLNFGQAVVHNLTCLSSGHACNVARTLAQTDDEYNEWINTFMDGVEG